MKARLALRLASTSVALGVLTVACGGSDTSSRPLTDGGGPDSTTTGNDGSAEASRDGFGTEAAGSDGTTADGARSDAGAAEGGADSGDTDGGGLDATVADTGGQDSTAVDAGVMEAAADTGSADTGAADMGASDTGAADTGGADTGADAGTQDSSVDSETDAGVDSGADAAVDGGIEAGGGPQCTAADGGTYQCNAGEHCCANASTQVSSCAAACDPDAGTYPVDCTGSSATGQCGSQLCCGMLVLSGGTVPNCNASELITSCATSCSDTPPGVFSNCMGSYTIRLCNAAADCTSDTGQPSCCRFGSSPVYWCVDTTTAIVGTCLP